MDTYTDGGVVSAPVPRKPARRRPKKWEKVADSVDGEALVPSVKMPDIKNKMRRSAIYQKKKEHRDKIQRDGRLKRKKDAAALGDQAPPKKQPRTIENTKEEDPTLVDMADEEVQRDITEDEFASYFNGKTPKIIVTTSMGAKKHTMIFADLLSKILHEAAVFHRRSYSLQQIIRYATHKSYTDLVVLNENKIRSKKKTSDLIVVHLPRGPTARFKVMDLKLPEELGVELARTQRCPCELILNNFSTRLGLYTGRMIACLFPQKPDFELRRVATFHCQRDYIFFRHHRYIFEESQTDHQKSQSPLTTRLQEIGPRFVLKLMSLQLGTLDTVHGEYIFTFRKELRATRKRFFL
eukprot:TRINITY_DN7167_c0_g1_i1.p1 TRINITY_DN7167_c0_g1~~TRINITY_DN7167_c0_g1_i1.p1  ORF type:complete len:352 (+),score=108.07 TRINITY_DN7167_c0_g1_i1:365-1420(+)